jgi:hypothetical protein
MVQCSAYTSHEEASQAVQVLLASGVPGEGIRVLMGEPERDARAEEMGAFAGSVAVDVPRGGFAGARAGMGSFAGDHAAPRGGSFADADREIETSYPAGVAHQRVAGHHRVKQLLIDAGLDEATADRDVDALHEGRILVLAQVQASSERRSQ